MVLYYSSILRCTLHWFAILGHCPSVESPISIVDRSRVSEIVDQIEFLVQYNDLNRCTVLGFIQWRAFLIINAMLGVIMITRLHVMYQRSRAMLIFLVITFLAITVACGVIVAKQSSPISWHEIIVLGTYHCVIEGTDPSVAKSWILITVWEVLALCLAVWITLKHFRELRRSRIGSTIRDWFTVLIKSHVLYFAAFTAVSCFNLGLLSPSISGSFSAGLEIYNGILRIISLLQMFVLGPRLILTIREYHAALVNTSDEGTHMTTLAFRERSHVSTGSDV
ncbi:hypothetical protein CY34DRAFT_810116 [Suillus luteus UH-Slu-Lm8-n1]|uniref:Unplaced genomic scaffold CY34scaffold_304, whole genome shotgun sequence n=1 Tax=Suillus luteus UH-Slu-Lm8-n1 TaxID=930992 RepID=A0A0D0AHU1_9AGAM|nr:hypothetical protein CY34DRAFT_810116 [Suillus luteus UH-Slu-Lm8-n1]